MPSTTLTYSTQLAQRFAAAVGDDWNLRDENGERRPATGPECKQWFIDRVREVIHRKEGPELAAANPPPQPDPVDMT